MNLLPVSVLIIGQNVEWCLKRCLDSVTDFAQVVFVDGGSQDKTATIALSYPNVSYHLNPWPGFIPQREFSLSKADHEWCLMLDADEALTPKAVELVREVLKRPKPKAMYRLVRTEYYEGHQIESGFGRSNYQERLFQKTHVSYTGGVHHEHMIKGERSRLGHPEIEDLDPEARILHDPSYGLDEMIGKLPRFSILIGYEKYSRGRRVSAWGVIFSFVTTFVQVYAKSWKAGRVGLMTSLLEAHHRSLVKMVIYNIEHFKNGEPEPTWEKKPLG